MGIVLKFTLLKCGLYTEVHFMKINTHNTNIPAALSSKLLGHKGQTSSRESNFILKRSIALLFISISIYVYVSKTVTG